MAILTINGWEAPDPKLGSYTVAKEKVWSKNTGRNAEGTMFGDIKARKIKITCTFAVLTESQMASLSAAIDSDTNFFPVYYLDIDGTTKGPIQCYAGNPEYARHTTVDGYPKFLDVSISLIEQ